MELRNNFYQVQQQSGERYKVCFNAEHFIYKAHFPDNPITPGVCIIQTAKELMEERLGKKLQIIRVINAKFLEVIDTCRYNEVWFAFSNIMELANGYKFVVNVNDESGEVVFAKINLEVRC